MDKGAFKSFGLQILKEIRTVVELGNKAQQEHAPEKVQHFELAIEAAASDGELLAALASAFNSDALTALREELVVPRTPAENRQSHWRQKRSSTWPRHTLARRKGLSD